MSARPDPARAPDDRPPLLTARLRLRRPVAADAAAVIAIAGDRRVASRLSRMPHPYGEAEFRVFLDHVVPDELVWAVTERATGALVGIAGLVVAPDGRTAELGFYVAPARWGEGIATEAAGAIVGHGFAALGLAAIVAGHFAGNPASGRVLARLGFVATGAGERHCLSAGRALASVEMRLDAPGGPAAR